jgi:hypothetical protein
VQAIWRRATTARRAPSGLSLALTLALAPRSSLSLTLTKPCQAGPERITFEPRTVKAKGKGLMETFLCTDLNAGHSRYGSAVGDRTQAADVVQSSKGKGKRQRQLSVSIAQDSGSHTHMTALTLVRSGAAAAKAEGGRRDSADKSRAKTAAMGEESVALSRFTLQFLESAPAGLPAVPRGRLGQAAGALAQSMRRPSGFPGTAGWSRRRSSSRASSIGGSPERRRSVKVKEGKVRPAPISLSISLLIPSPSPSAYKKA